MTIVVLFIILYIAVFVVCIIYHTTDYEWVDEDCRKFYEIDVPLTTETAWKTLLWPIWLSYVFIRDFYGFSIHSLKWICKFVRLLISIPSK